MPLTDVSGKARALHEARRTRQAIEPFTDADPELGMADGYAIAQQLTSLLLADGDEVIGYKVGLTSKPMQQLVGVSSPDHGPVLDTGAGAAALGDPIAVVAWLANTLGEMGGGLEAGQLVMTGALHAAVPMQAGDVFRAEFDRLGPVTVRVVE